MTRRTWLLMIGPPRIEAAGWTADGYCWHMSTPCRTGTLDIFAEQADVPHSELRRLAACWFRDAFAHDLRRGPTRLV